MADAGAPSLQTQPDASLVIHTIPMDFYGGRNPAPQELPPVAAPATPTTSASVVTPQQPPKAPGAGTLQQPVKPAVGSKKWMIWVVLGVVVLGGGAATAWVLLTPPAVEQPPISPVPVAVTTTTPEVVPDVTPTSTATSTAPEITAPTSTPLIGPHAYADSADGDNDGLTDIEEELLATNGGAADSDGDGYNDLLELMNLYNPAGIAPQRLIETNSVSTYINSEYKYSVYYPASWVARPLDEDTKREVLFTAITGEFVKVMAVPYPPNQAFPDWFAQNLPNEQLAAYKPFTNKMKVSGIMSPDNTVAIITDGSTIYLLSYDGGTRSEINYRSLFRMMVQSFKTGNVTTPVDLLPSKTTSSGVATSTPGGMQTSTPEFIDSSEAETVSGSATSTIISP